MGKKDFNTCVGLRKAALKRRLDAEALAALPGEQHVLAAMYLAGYAVECKLKATAMEAFHCRNLEELIKRWKVQERDVYTHGLEAIVKRLGLYNNFCNSRVYNQFITQVNKWRPSWRYDHRNRMPKEGRAFLDAVKEVNSWLDSNRY